MKDMEEGAGETEGGDGYKILVKIIFLFTMNHFALSRTEKSPGN